MSNYLFMKENQSRNEANDNQKVRIEQLHQRSKDNLARLFEQLTQKPKNGE